MAKYEVVKIYVDKETHKCMHEGAEVELSDKRAKELKDFVKKIENKTEKKKIDK